MKPKRPWYSQLLFALVVAAVVWVVYRNIGEIRTFDFSYRWGFILLAFLFEILAYITQFGIWVGISKEFGLKAPVPKAAKGFFLSQLGKYIPGKVGLVLVRMDAYRGYSKKQVAVATGFEMVSSLASACLLVLLGVVSASALLPSYSVWIAVFGFVLILIFLYPPLFLRLINLGFRIIKRAPIEKSPSYKTTLKFISAFMLVGLLHGMGLFFVLNSLAALSFSHFLTVTGVYYAAGLVGLFAVFAPAGIGVREGIMMLVLPAFIAEPVVIVGAIIIRLLMTTAELLLAGASVMIEKISRN